MHELKLEQLYEIQVSEMNDKITEEVAIIAKEAEVEGRISFRGTVRVHGQVKGQVDCDHMIILEGGQVTGAVTCKEATVGGRLQENIIVEGPLNVLSSGKVIGKCSYQVLQIEKGGVIEGEAVVLPGDGNKKSKGKVQATVLTVEEIAGSDAAYRFPDDSSESK